MDISRKEDIKEFLRRDAEKDMLRFSTAGSVDDGKSTLIGRLLHDSKQIYEDQLDSVKTASGKVNSGLEIDYALITDGLKAEREQGITIDVAYRYFSTPRRKFIIADTPGHEQYTRNMATGASTANLSLILIDARNGVLTQSKRHAFISSLLGIPHIIVAVNKMDLVGYSREIFEKIKKDFSDFASKLNIPDMRFVPISALKGDNVVERGKKNMPWHGGETVLEMLENTYIGSDKNFIDLRFPVQYVIRPDLDFRGYSGKISSGIIRRGDAIAVLPSMKTSKIESIITFDGKKAEAVAGESVTVTLKDEIDISRGNMLVHRHNLPHRGKHFEAMTVWMDDEPLDPDSAYIIKHGANTVPVRIDEIRYKVNVNNMHREQAGSLGLNEIGRVVFTAARNIFYDPYGKNKATGSFIVIDRITNNTIAAGMILDREPEDSLPAKIKPVKDGRDYELPDYSMISAEDKARRFGQKPVTLWFTGLASSGKREIAFRVEKELFDRGYASVVLDAGSVRARLNRELDFTEGGRAENLRRVAEMSRILNNNGLISLCAFVSPSAGVREQIAEIIAKERFLEIFVDASLEFCGKRDKNGFYEKAGREQISSFTGINAPYDRPENPVLTLNMDEIPLGKAVEKVMALLEEKEIIGGNKK